MAAPKPTPTKKIADPAPASETIEVTPEVTVAETSLPRPLIGLSRPLFQTTTEDAPPLPNVAPATRKMTPKTLAEHAAGREAISQYAPAAE